MTDSQVKKIVFEDGLIIRTKADIAALYRKNRSCLMPPARRSN